MRGPLPLVEIVEDIKAGEVKNERTGANAAAKFPFEYINMPKDAKTRRELLAKWITSKDNPYFARSYVNRVWSYLLGVGLIEPIDDIRAGNPPTNPQLLDRLGEEFIKSKFDVRELVKIDLQVAHLSALGRHQRLEQGRRRQLLARPRPPAAGRGALRFDPSGDRGEIASAATVRGRSPCSTRASERRAGSSSCSAGRRASRPANASGPAACSLAQCST